MLLKKARNSVALIMAAVLVLCSFAICDFTAFAKIPIETTTAEFDFSEGFANGAPTVNNRVGEGQISFFQYRSSGYETYNASGIYHERNNGTYSNYYSEPYVGCFEEDGLVFIDNLKNYIKDDYDFEITWKYYIYNKGFTDNYGGYFSLGTEFNSNNKGRASYDIAENEVLSLSFDGRIRQGSSVYSDKSFSAAAAGEKDCSVYYSADDKTFTITVNGVSQTVSTSYKPSQMNYFGIGSSSRSSYGKYIVKNITVKTIEQRLEPDECKSIISDAMSAYENKMASGNIYKNMLPAYRAYVNCQKAYDAYIYGKVTNINIRSYADELNKAISNMTVWTAPKGNFIPSFSTEDSCNSLNAVNCLWAESSDDPVVYQHTQVNNTANFYYHTSVYMYDGNMQIPFLIGFYRYAALGNPRNPRIWYAKMTGQNGGLSISRSYYSGDILSRDFRRIYTSSYHIGAEESTNYSIILSTGDVRYMANHFTFASSPFGSSEFYKKAYPTAFKIGYGNKDTQNVESHDFQFGDAKVFYVLNYKSILDYINSDAYKNYFKNISDFREGGLEKLMAAYDNATVFDPNAYDYSNNTESQVSLCADKIRTVVEQFRNVGTIRSDSADYEKLRQKIQQSSSLTQENEIISNGSTRTTRYTPESWNMYSNALSTARAAMANVITSGGYSSDYNSKSISDIADNITSAISNLKYNYIIEYVHYDGVSMGSTVGVQDSRVDISLVKNTDMILGTQNEHFHYIYSWSDKVLSKSKYGDAEVVTVNEIKTRDECVLEEIRTITEASCTSPSIKLYSCTVCGAEFEITGDVSEHGYECTVVAPTCSEKGYTHYVCRVCGDSYDADYTDMLEHSYTAFVSEPTCTEKGYTSSRCVNCGYEVVDKNSYIPALGHQYTCELVSEANCIFAGAQEYTCTRCEDTYIEEIPINSNIHSDMIYSRTVAPTEIEQGYDIYYCSNFCGYWEKRNFIPAIGGDSNLADYIEIYNAAVANLVTDFAPYTQESIDAYNQITEQAKAKGEQAVADSLPSDIELAAKTLIEASSVLRIKTLDVVIYINCSDDEVRELVYSSEGVSYGDSINVDISNELGKSNVKKWTVEQNGETKRLALSSASCDMVITDDAVINVYLTDDEVEIADSSKVTMLNNDGRVIGTAYVNNGSVLDLDEENQFDVTAPELPFYRFAGWQIVEGSQIVTADTVIKATYKVV